MNTSDGIVPMSSNATKFERTPLWNVLGESKC